MGPGVDPHLYKASEGDLRALEKADIIFYNGLHLEAGLAGCSNAWPATARTVAVSDSIERAL
jgi:manganese/zinc/iron transport system substrate-binding protein